MLELRNVNTFYGNIQALRDVNIRINEGEIVTLIGANGAGKSTTLMTICGGTPPRSGEVLFRGHPIHTLRPNKIVALGISQVPEGRLIFPDLTVQENLDLGAFLRNDKDNIKKDLDYIFDLFPILAQRRAQTGGTLSGGEQQMLAISRAIMARPTLLLLDEPSLGLAPIINLWSSLTLDAQPPAMTVAQALYPTDPARRDDAYSELCSKRSRGRAVVWALQQGGQTVCTVGAYAIANGQAYMACGQTAEPLRGKGIGGRLIVQMANALAAEGEHPVFLCAPERVHFYTRLGFAKLGEYVRFAVP